MCFSFFGGLFWYCFVWFWFFFGLDELKPSPSWFTSWGFTHISYDLSFSLPSDKPLYKQSFHFVWRRRCLFSGEGGKSLVIIQVVFFSPLPNVHALTLLHILFQQWHSIHSIYEQIFSVLELLFLANTQSCFLFKNISFFYTENTQRNRLCNCVHFD